MILIQTNADSHHNTATHNTMVAVALYFARRLTHPPAAQFCSIDPNRRCCHSQSCKRGELRAAAQLASKINTVVGNPGISTPATPNPRHNIAILRNSQRIHLLRDSAGAETTGRDDDEVTGIFAGMAQIVPVFIQRVRSGIVHVSMLAT